MRRVKTMPVKKLLTLLISCFLPLLSFDLSAQPKRKIVIGSKAFTENYILAEIIAQKLESKGIAVERRFGMGGTGILFQALMSKMIDVYPEYTGTIARSLLKTPYTGDDNETFYKKLSDIGLDITESIGPNNTYALGMILDTAKELKISTISDLKNTSDLKAAFSHEFYNRSDGYKGLKNFYGLTLKNVRSIEHALAYEALESHQIDLTDIYSTDAKIQSLGLRVLKDDLHFFPKYLPVALVQKEFKRDFPRAWSSIKELEGMISTSKMIELNSRVDIDKISYTTTVSEFLQTSDIPRTDSLTSRVAKRLKEHILLVGMAFLISFTVGFPLGILATESPILGRIILNFSGLVQAIPSLALLCFLIPVFGIGTTPALVALSLYGLLPIVINTFTGLTSLDKKYHEISLALGLSKWESLVYTKIPMAAPSIFAGIKTSIIIGIGTATLSALIGAGGHGVPIMRGLAMNDTWTILEGAIPAALLSLLASFILDKIGRVFTTFP